MSTLSYNGTDYTVDHAVKGTDYIHGYDASGALVVSFNGVTSFSGFTYDGTYMSPDACADEPVHAVRFVDNALMQADGAPVVPFEVAKPGRYWVQNGATLTGCFTKLAYSANTYMVAGDDLWLSTDLTNFETGPISDIFDITTGNGITVAITPTLALCTYDDGQEWEHVTVRTSFTASSRVSFCTNRFFIFDETGHVYISNVVLSTADTLHMFLQDQQFPACAGGRVAYGNGKYVLAPSSATDGLQVSTDGTSWSSLGVGAGRYWYDITYSNGIFVAVSQDLIARSSDGSTWVFSDGWSLGTTPTVSFYDGFFLVPDLSHNRVLRSADGITWDTDNNGVLNATGPCSRIVGPKYALATYDSTSGKTNICYSKYRISQYGKDITDDVAKCLGITLA